MKLIALTVVLILSACGFTPVYAPSMQSGPVQTNMSSIAIDVIPNREGQVVRNHLIDQLHKDGYPTSAKYRLIISPIVENIVEIGIDKDDEASRAQLRERANMQFIRLSDNKIILDKTVRSVSSYNILAGQFTTFVTEQDAREQALRSLAADIVAHLEVYFSNEA